MVAACAWRGQHAAHTGGDHPGKDVFDLHVARDLHEGEGGGDELFIHEKRHDLPAYLTSGALVPLTCATSATGRKSRNR